ncbi:MAG: peptidase [Synechococcus sp. Baikal-G1]|nr:MAG: peptidase [Synechococcus sp. Baikal-G1]
MSLPGLTPQRFQQVRRLHGAVAPLVLAPLLLTVCSGMTYRLLKDWAGLGRDQLHVLMVLHEGEWLGKALEPFYVLLNGLGLLWMLITGASLVLQRWRQGPRPAKSAGPEGSA